MRRFRSGRAVAIGALCLFALMAVGILLAAQNAIGQEQPRAPTAPEVGAERGRGGERPMAGGGEERRLRAERADEARQRFDQERARRVAAEMSMMRQPPAIAVAEGKVFLVMSGMLYKFDAETLALEAQQRIPLPPAAAELLERMERRPAEPRERPAPGEAGEQPGREAGPAER